jgi:hypothetical protein
MKKLTLFLLFAVAGVAAYAQGSTETFTAKAVKKGEEPQAVINAVKQDFPKAIVSDLNVVSGKLYGEQWAINFDDKTGGSAPEYYHVMLKESNSQYSAYYNKKGDLISSKTYVNNEQLPTEVTSAVHNKYPDWTIIKDGEKITYKQGSVKEAYKVDIQKDKMHRSLLMDGSGNIHKDKALKHLS